MVLKACRKTSGSTGSHGFAVSALLFSIFCAAIQLSGHEEAKAQSPLPSPYVKAGNLPAQSVNVLPLVEGRDGVLYRLAQVYNNDPNSNGDVAVLYRIDKRGG